MPILRSARNAMVIAVTAALGTWAYQSAGARDRAVEEAWSFDMWCLEMQSYPAQRCNSRNAEDLVDYAQYRSDVEKYRQDQQDKLKRDQNVLQRLNRNAPGPPDQTGR